MKEFDLRVDLVDKVENETIYINQGDIDSVKFFLTITNEGVAHDLTNFTSVRMTVRKPSGYTFTQACTVTDAINGKCQIVLSDQAYNEIGLIEGEVEIVQNLRTYVSRRFSFQVLRSIT